MEAWTVTERKMIWDRATREWWTDERIIESGISKQRADWLLRQDHSRGATPDGWADRHKTCANLEGEATEET